MSQPTGLSAQDQPALSRPSARFHQPPQTGPTFQAATKRPRRAKHTLQLLNPVPENLSGLHLHGLAPLATAKSALRPATLANAQPTSPRGSTPTAPGGLAPQGPARAGAAFCTFRAPAGEIQAAPPAKQQSSESPRRSTPRRPGGRQSNTTCALLATRSLPDFSRECPKNGLPPAQKWTKPALFPTPPETARECRRQRAAPTPSPLGKQTPDAVLLDRARRPELECFRQKRKPLRAWLEPLAPGPLTVDKKPR